MFNIGNISGMMQQVKEMQEDIKVAKVELENKVYKATVAGVTVEMTGLRQVTKVSISDVLMADQDKAAIETATLKATNAALKQIEQELAERFSKYADKFPGGLPF